MTSSPVIASIKEALVYDMDLETVRSVSWKDTCIAKQYNDILTKKGISLSSRYDLIGFFMEENICLHTDMQG